MDFLDSAFKAFRRRKDDSEREQFIDSLAEAIVTRTFGAPMSDEERAEIERRDRLATEGAQARRERMREMGVDVGSFTERKVIADARAILRDFFPETSTMDVDLRTARVTVDFQNLTKTGRLPKNVARAQLICDSKPGAKPEESLVVNMKYLRDGSLNMADVNAWRNKIGISVSVRIVDGSHRITYVTRTDILRDLYDPLYSMEAGSANPVEVACKALRKAGGR